jgi:hypothetical protein
MTDPAKGSTESPSETSPKIEFWLGVGCAAVAAVSLAAWSLDHRNRHRSTKSSELSNEPTRLDQDARAALLDYYGSLLRSWSERLVALAVALFSVVLARPYLTANGFQFWLSCVMALAIFAIVRMVWHGALAEHMLHVPPLSQADLGAQETGEVKPYLHRLDEEMKKRYKQELGRIRYGILYYSGRFPYWIFLIIVLCVAFASVVHIAWPLLESAFLRDPF